MLTVATRNGCHLCVAMHTATLVRHAAAPELIDALRAGTSLPEPRLEALRRFTSPCSTTRCGPEDELDAFLAAGWQPRHALDVVLGVGTYTISTFANRLTAPRSTRPDRVRLEACGLTAAGVKKGPLLYRRR